MSAGFDAARGDPLGGCLVTPECYAHMTHLLLGLAGGKVAVVLEVGKTEVCLYYLAELRELVLSMGRYTE